MKYYSEFTNENEEKVISDYLSKYATDNSMTFTLTNETVVEAYLNEAKKLLEVFEGNDIIIDFIDLLENIEERKTKPTPEVSEE